MEEDEEGEWSTSVIATRVEQINKNGIFPKTSFFPQESFFIRGNWVPRVLGEFTNGEIGLKKDLFLIGNGAEFGGKSQELIFYLFFLLSGTSRVGLKEW